jgi:hypothetical protein
MMTTPFLTPEQAEILKAEIKPVFDGFVTLNAGQRVHVIIDRMTLPAEPEPCYPHGLMHCRVPLVPQKLTEPVEWRAGDVAWDNKRGSLCKLDRFKGAAELQYMSCNPSISPTAVEHHSASIPATWLCDDGRICEVAHLTRPTRSHLAVTIRGTTVQAWAWECSRTATHVYVTRSDAIDQQMEMMHRDIALAIGLIIVSAGQVERHYPNGYPLDDKQEDR